ncbi:hypothetical protein Emed_007671 [Eimeria media]
MTPAGRFLLYVEYHDRYPTSRRPPYIPEGNLLPAVADMIGRDPGHSSSGPEWPSSSSESGSEGPAPTPSTTVGTGLSSSQATADFPQVHPPPRHSPPPAPAAPPAQRRRRESPDGVVGLVLYEAPLEDQERSAVVVLDESESRETSAIEEVTAEVILEESTEGVLEASESRESSTEEGSTIASRVARRHRRRC